ncbi:tRNA pseudouridine(65) synthase TruC [Thalassotalea ponticola]|uniref:tRNA pseudouridine(65) synthase TruC n=1 Tax=Thalassotalea ponticola TaxID=1523392 RepID=UPI0025B48273|nr:tRNA pseudouridine(65) synthase TruC [Thalassotalea ponticola]MDN3651579.1 tRNA pseudouridine(65) synthase TruC [Thalassotalea ponticola]
MSVDNNGQNSELEFSRGTDAVSCPEDAEKPELYILYQDEYLIAVNKPSGLFVHRSYLDRDQKYFALQLVRDMVGKYVYPLHRLDRPTSGVLLFAFDQQTARIMGQMFTDKTIAKRYLAICRGHLPEHGRVEHPLKEKLDKIGDKYASDNTLAKQAVTDFTRLATATLPIALGKYPTIRYSLVALVPHTGRRHQIRRHLAHLRHPIIGDINYGDNKQNPFFRNHFGVNRLMLHAQQLSFNHPVTQTEVIIDAPLDQQWLDIISKLGWHQAVQTHTEGGHKTSATDSI